MKLPRPYSFGSRRTRESVGPVSSEPVRLIPSASTRKGRQTRFLSIREASVYSGLPQKELRRLIKSGVLPSVRDGLRRQIRSTDLDDFAAVTGSAKSGGKGAG